jgi:hypothetical protein
MVVALPSCAHLGPLEFPPPGTDLTTQEMSSTIFLWMAIAKTFLRNPRLTSIARCILIHALHFRNANLADLCFMWSECRPLFLRGHGVFTISLKFSRLQTRSSANSYAFQELPLSHSWPRLTAKTESQWASFSCYLIVGEIMYSHSYRFGF